VSDLESSNISVVCSDDFIVRPSSWEKWRQKSIWKT